MHDKRDNFPVINKCHLTVIHGPMATDYCLLFSLIEVISTCLINQAFFDGKKKMPFNLKLLMQNILVQLSQIKKQSIFKERSLQVEVYSDSVKNLIEVEVVGVD